MFDNKKRLESGQQAFVTSALSAAATATACAVALACAGSAQASPTVTECQHPVTTGAEFFDAKHVSKATACRVVNALHKYVATSGNPSIYKCAGPPTDTVTLLKTKFDGWTMKYDNHRGFQMSRGDSSFYVTGTDFPVPCN